MESVGYKQNRFYGTPHTESYSGGSDRGGNIALNEDDWHTYEIYWEPGQIQWAVDGQISFELARADLLAHGLLTKTFTSS